MNQEQPTSSVPEDYRWHATQLQRETQQFFVAALEKNRLTGQEKRTAMSILRTTLGYGLSHLSNPDLEQQLTTVGERFILSWPVNASDRNVFLPSENNPSYVLKQRLLAITKEIWPQITQKEQDMEPTPLILPNHLPYLAATLVLFAPEYSKSDTAYIISKNEVQSHLAAILASMPVKPERNTSIEPHAQPPVLSQPELVLPQQLQALYAILDSSNIRGYSVNELYGIYTHLQANHPLSQEIIDKFFDPLAFHQKAAAFAEQLKKCFPSPQKPENNP